jgi:DNA-binding NarL/FixJ family response regulator
MPAANKSYNSHQGNQSNFISMDPIKVSVVEDIPELRDGLISLLQWDDRFEAVSSHKDAESAVDHIIAMQPDIVIMDINLPGMTGIECIRKIKKDCRNTQFIMFTIYEDDEHLFDALEAGASGYILKKASHMKILDSLEELYKGGAPMCTTIARKVINRFRVPEVNDLLNISEREKEVLTLLGKGLLYKEIGEQLHITTGTVKQHIHRIYEKMHVQNRTEAINKFNRK